MERSGGVSKVILKRLLFGVEFFRFRVFYVGLVSTVVVGVELAY